MVDLFQLFGTSELSKEGGNPHEKDRVTPKNQQNATGFRCTSCGQDLSDSEHHFLLVSGILLGFRAPCLVEAMHHAQSPAPNCILVFRCFTLRSFSLQRQCYVLRHARWLHSWILNGPAVWGLCWSGRAWLCLAAGGYFSVEWVGQENRCLGQARIKKFCKWFRIWFTNMKWKCWRVSEFMI